MRFLIAPLFIYYLSVSCRVSLLDNKLRPEIIFSFLVKLQVDTKFFKKKK